MNFNNVKEFMDRLCSWIIPGNSIVIYKDNEKVFQYSAGYFDLENKVKMKDDAMFNIYSCSKVATVIGAMQLFEKGHFLFTTPLYDFIPEFRDVYIENEKGDVVKCDTPITMHHIFTMTAGLYYNYGGAMLERVRQNTDGKMNTLEFVREIARETKNKPLCFVPGTRWQYSFCHDILAAVVEVISGMKFRDYMTKNIFHPLGMYETFYHIPEDKLSRVACQYNYKVTETDPVKLQSSDISELGELENVGKTNNYLRFGCEYDSGGAGIVTTMDDYALLMNALANDGIGKTGEKIISRASIDLIRTPQLSKEAFTFTWPNLEGYGYGLGVRTMADKTIGSGSLSNIGEFGWGGAAGASVFVDPTERLAVSYAHHMLNPQEAYYQPRLRNTIYSSLD